MLYSVKYGHQKLSLAIPDTCPTDVIEPITVLPLEAPLEAFEAALDSPLGHPPLSALPQPASVAIAVPDETRPFPVRDLLPPLLERIFAAFPKLNHRRITIVVGGGLHEPPDQAQLDRVLPADSQATATISNEMQMVKDLVKPTPITSEAMSIITTMQPLRAAVTETPRRMR